MVVVWAVVVLEVVEPPIFKFGELLELVEAVEVVTVLVVVVTGVVVVAGVVLVWLRSKITTPPLPLW